MKIAISAQGAGLDSPVDPRFGRARYFIVIDTETGGISAHDNTLNLNAAQGAGIQAAKNVVDLGVQAVISGNVGPKAYSTLSAAGIEVYTGASGTVRYILDAFRAGKLSRVDKANVEGHWL
jgi:predicted Fe-Mo cluster-binding NifX family protein